MPNLNHVDTLQGTQSYIEDVMDKRGFKKESLPDKFMLLIEEIGELAKSVRKQSGIAVDTKNYHKRKGEQREKNSQRAWG